MLTLIGASNRQTDEILPLTIKADLVKIRVDLKKRALSGIKFPLWFQKVKREKKVLYPAASLPYFLAQLFVFFGGAGALRIMYFRRPGQLLLTLLTLKSATGQNRADSDLSD